MPKNIDKDSSELVLSNGSTITVTDFTTTNKSDLKGVAMKADSTNGMVNTITGEFVVRANYQQELRKTYSDLFEKGMNGESITQDDVYDLVKYANLAMWEEQTD